VCFIELYVNNYVTLVFAKYCHNYYDNILRKPESHLRGTGIRGLMRGMATLPQGNQELLVVRESWKTPGELGVSKFM